MILQRARRGIRVLRAEHHARTLFSDLTADQRTLIDRLRAERLTYLRPARLASIAATCREIESQGLDGVMLEAGCALGGSTILIASIKLPTRPLRVYDVFDMIPPPGEEDTPDVHARYRDIVAGNSIGIRGDRYYGYEEDLYGRVQSNLASFGIDQERQSLELIKGLLQDTMHVDEPVAFAHVDVDWHDPVMTCLERIFPRLVPGGSIILDDYHDWGGCRKATDAFLQHEAGAYTLDDSAGSLKITRT